jgi:ribosomal-protein-alanine N-acetyltransferase
MIELVPILQTPEENHELLKYEECIGTMAMTIDYYKIVGFNAPWIGYFVKLNKTMVGSAGFKGKPVDNKIEIAYGTFENFRGKGIGTATCRQLVALALKENPTLMITARTLPESIFSIKILQKNNFNLL